MQDNQFTQPTGLMEWFGSSMLSFNKMLRYANLTIEVKHEEDYTIIPVKVRTEDTLKVVESGIVVEEYTRCKVSDDDFDYSDEWREREDCA